MALPEAGQRFADKLAPLIEPLGYRLRSSVDEDEDDVNGVTAAVAARLGDVSFKVGHNTSTFPDVQITGGTLGALKVVAFHSVAPVPGAVPEWRDDMALLPTLVRGPHPGDRRGRLQRHPRPLHAPRGHGGLRRRGRPARRRAAPTWGPPRAPGSSARRSTTCWPTTASWRRASAVVDLPGSDHHAILTTLRLP